jgi:predicted metal-binding membrane protein
MQMAARDHRIFLPVVSAMVVLAWLTLAVWDASPYARYLRHDGLDEIRTGSDWPVLGLFVLGWVLMTAAMMLPTSLPLVAIFDRLTSRRADHARLVVLLVGGYLGVWTLFGVAVHLFDLGVHRAIASSAVLERHGWILGAATILLAGLYQFSPLKYRCLEECRSPLGFIVRHWRGHGERRHAFLLGLHHGLFCLGCCWSLMLLMFAVGVGNLGWMLGLGAVMAVEKNVPWGRRLTAPLGATLVTWALATAVHALVVAA